MILKKHFKHTDAGETLLAGLEFISIGGRPKQNLHCRQLDQYAAQGIADIGKTHITLKFLNGDKRFKIDTTPGIYCQHCKEHFPLDGPEVPRSQRGQIARDHVAEKHKGKKSSDPSNPSGYKVQSYYATTLEQ